jgi:hypothetical protein
LRDALRPVVEGVVIGGTIVIGCVLLSGLRDPAFLKVPVFGVIALVLLMTTFGVVASLGAVIRACRAQPIRLLRHL